MKLLVLACLAFVHLIAEGQRSKTMTLQFSTYLCSLLISHVLPLSDLSSHVYRPSKILLVSKARHVVFKYFIKKLDLNWDIRS